MITQKRNFESSIPQILPISEYGRLLSIYKSFANVLQKKSNGNTLLHKNLFQRKNCQKRAQPPNACFNASQLEIRPKKAERSTKIYKANQLETRPNFEIWPKKLVWQPCPGVNEGVAYRRLKTNREENLRKYARHNVKKAEKIGRILMRKVVTNKQSKAHNQQ